MNRFGISGIYSFLSFLNSRLIEVTMSYTKGCGVSHVPQAFYLAKAYQVC